MIEELIVEEIERYDVIVFAVIFGSFAESKETNISDIDIGLYTSRDLDLIEIGLMIARLECIVRKKVDIIILNNLYKKKPCLTFDVIAKGKLILCRDDSKFMEFRKNTLLYYLDTEPLRYLMDKRFRNRLNEKRFGERNYVGTA
jgi:predicted nucleotidyltransferase